MPIRQMESMMKIQRSKIDNFTKINTIPPVLAQLLQELEKEDFTINSIAQIINTDISLTARLLRASNTAFYRRQTEINTIDKAIAVLGVNAVRALALSVSLFDIGGKICFDEFSDLKNFWYHNLETAVISQKLANVGKFHQPEEVFVCGLLHDLGLLFFIQEYSEQYSEVLKLKNDGYDISNAEDMVFGATHSEVGNIIAVNWNLPDSICNSIANHHEIDITEKVKSKPENWHIVNLAHRFCHQGFDIPTDLPPTEIELRNNLVEMLGLDKLKVNQVIKDTPQEVIRAASFLDIDIGDPLSLLQTANDKLGNLYELYDKAKVENENLQTKLLHQEKNKTAIEALKTTLATLSHYVNNANAAIVGRAQILDLYLDQGRLEDPEGKISKSIKIITESVDVISAVLDELKDFHEYKTVKYHDNSRILDIDKNIKARLRRLA